MRLRTLVAGGGGIVLVAALAAAVLRPAPAEIPDPTTYAGSRFAERYDFAPLYSSWKKRSSWIELPDGTRLAADVFLPADPTQPPGGGRAAPPDGPFPTILSYTPYGRAQVEPGMPLWQRLVLWYRFHLPEPLYDASFAALNRILLARGYAVVGVDMRGTGASEGSQAPLMPRLGDDGARVVEWITAQPWSDGSVAMTGQSYLGWSQFATAARRPEGLECIAPETIHFDTYSEAFRPGGILAARWLREYDRYLGSYNRSRMLPDSNFRPVAPVVDEDADGRLVDEVPLADAGDPELFVDDVPPRYADGAPRTRHLLHTAVRRHLDNTPVTAFMSDRFRVRDRSVAFAGDTFPLVATSPAAMLAPVAESGIPVFNVGGWFDGFTEGTARLHATLSGAGAPSRLMMAPRFHVPSNVAEPYRDELGYEGALSADVAIELLRFFDHCLKGEANGWADADPVSLYVVNRGWRTASAWPPEDARATPFVLAEEGRLAPTWDEAAEGAVEALLSPAEGPVEEAAVDTFAVDFTHRSDYGSNRVNRWLMMFTPDSVMTRERADAAAVVYETEPLQEGLEVVGHPVVHLRLGANQPDADAFVYLSDVGPDGRARYVTEGQHRAGFHRLADPASLTAGTLAPLPALPWHGFSEADLDPAPLAGGEVVSLRFDLQPVGWYFAPGHRVRISIAGADLGNFELNPTLCPTSEVGSCRPTELHLHRGGPDASRIELPVVGGGGLQ
jgi:hypothetical protein